MSLELQREPMLHAIEAVRSRLTHNDGGPFGACIVRDGQVLAVARNTVLAQRDPTCHAEMNAIRAACAALGTHDLSGCLIYSTTEPCPMCFSAIHWAKIGHIVYGTRIADVAALGFNELHIPNAVMKRESGSSIGLHGDFMRAECLALLAEWDTRSARETY